MLDFGVTLSLDTDSGPITRAAGTPGYMAPEQRDGSAAQDVRTDVWAAAQLLRECLLGRPSSGCSIDDVDVPTAVRGVLRRALAADPSARPSSARELRIALGRAGGRIAAPVSAPRPWWHRGRLVVLSIAAALASGVTLAKLRDAGDAERVGARPTIAEINTSWESRFGALELRVDDDGRAYGVYEHDQGILVGKYDRGVLTGWWCEEPTRRPSDDAGLVQMLFVRGADRILIDGQWKYGDDPKTRWVRDWNGVSVDKPPVPELEQRMQQHVMCPPPR